MTADLFWLYAIAGAAIVYLLFVAINRFMTWQSRNTVERINREIERIRRELEDNG